MIDAATVESWLGSQGRPCERIDPATWRSAFHGGPRSFRFFVRLTEDWIFFTIAPFVVAPRSPGAEHRLHRQLLRLNREINLAKFAIDEDADVVLTVELPTENLDPSEFKDAIDALIHYADQHYEEVARVAQQED
jgi:hypothetical protein